MRSLHQHLGVVRRINGAGTLTRLGGSLIAAPVLDAMREGFEHSTLRPFPVLRTHTLSDAAQAYRDVLRGNTERIVLRP